MMKLVLKWLIENNIRHPLICISLSLLVTAIGVWQIPHIQMDFGDRLWFQKDDPNIVELDAFEKTFGTDETAALVVHFKEGVFLPKNIEILKDLTERMWKVPRVIRVDSLTNYHYTYGSGDDIITEPFIVEDKEYGTTELKDKRQEAANHLVIPNLYVNPNGNVAVLYGQLAVPEDEKVDTEEIFQGMKKVASKYESSESIKFYYLGGPVLNHEFQRTSFEDLGLLLPILFLIVFIYFVYNFRSLVGIVIPFGVIVTSILSTMGLIPLFGMKINSLTFILPSVILSIAIADSVHLIASFYLHFKEGVAREEAVRRAMYKNLKPIFLTSVTTAIGFFSLASSTIIPIYQLGILAGLGAVFALIHSYCLCGPLLMLFKARPAKSLRKGNLNSFFSEKVTKLIDRYRVLIVAVFGSLTVAMALIAAQNIVNANAYKYFNADSIVSKANFFVLDNFGGVGGPELVVDSGTDEGIKDPEFLRKVAEFQDWIESREKVSQTISIVDILKEMHQALNGGSPSEYRIADSKEMIGQELFVYMMGLPVGMGINNRVDIRNRKLRISVKWTVQDSTETMKELRLFEQKAKELGLDVIATGKAVLFPRLNEYIISTFARSITLALIMITLVFVVIFKSVKIGLFSLIPNVVPLVFGGGVLYLLGIEIDTGCAIVASVTLGIAVDDTIHFLNHYYEERKKGVGEFEAVKYVFQTSALPLTLTTVILASCFAVFLFSSLIPNRNFGIISAVVLTTALICDLVFLPGLILFLDRLKGKTGTEVAHQ